MTIEDLRLATVLPFLLLMGGVVVGYLRIMIAGIREGQSSTVVFSASILLMMSLLAARAAYSVFVGPVPDIGGIAMNVFGIVGALLSLKTLHLLIPASERDEWHWYSAPLYPPFEMLSRLRSILRRR